MNQLDPVTREQVIACYNLFLRREPETEQVVQDHIAHHGNLAAMIEAFSSNDEALRLNMPKVSGHMNRSQSSDGVDVHVSDGDAEALVRRVEAAWSQLGREDVYFSVLTNPRFHSETIAEADLAEFFESGGADVDFFEAVCARNGLKPDPVWRIAELGCGVGRVGAHFAAAYRHYIGIDVSRPHIRVAEETFAKRTIANATFLVLDEFLTLEPRFDVLYSYLVLQHNPPPIMYRLLDRLLACLSPGGVAYFQVPCFLYNYAFDAKQYVAAATDGGGMEMHALPQKYVFELFQKHGVTPIEVMPSDCIGPIGFSFSFLGRKAA